MMTVTRVAVIGLGAIAARHRANLKIVLPGAEIIVMSASGRMPTEPVANGDRLVEDMDELVSAKTDMAVIASPATCHVEHALALIEHGIPVLIEKPVAATVDDALRLQAVASRVQTPVAVAYCLRYLPSLIAMQSLLSEQRVGELYNILINVGQYLPDWRSDKHYRDSVSANKALGGGVLLELSHEIDYAEYLFGPLTAKHATLRSSRELGLDVEDIADIVLTHQTGAVCYMHLDFLQKSVQRCCSVIGAKGRLDWNLLDNSITLITADSKEVIYKPRAYDRNQMYLSMLTDFLSLMQGSANTCTTLNSGINVLKQVEVIKGLACDGSTL